MDIDQLDVPVNAVATALKEFVSKRVAHLMPEEQLALLEQLLLTSMEPSERRLELRKLMRTLPVPNHALLKHMFRHFAR